MRLVVADASLVVSAALKATSTPALALLAARTEARLAMSQAVRGDDQQGLSTAIVQRHPEAAIIMPRARRPC